MKDKIKAALFGLSVGDALGVPVEFNSRESLIESPVVNMRAFGSWNQPAGTWSDDASLSFCLADSLCKGYSVEDIAATFVAWYQQGYWGAHHKVFDIGGATRFALQRIIAGESPLHSGGILDKDNGNGSLMRILPLVFHINHLPIDERYRLVKEVSGITHAHFRSVFACFVYVEFAKLLLAGVDKKEAYKQLRFEVNAFAKEQEFADKELDLFGNILQKDISKFSRYDIQSTGYVLHTLEASLWCILTTNSYNEAVLKAVNLGSDTDTTGCVTGGLAGLLYGFDAIPQEWVQVLARKEDVEELCERLSKKLAS